MKALRITLGLLKKGAGCAVLVVVILVIFWGIVHRLFLGFTPVWLDLATAGAVGAAMLVAWARGRSRKFDDSKRVATPPGGASPEQ